MEQAIVVTTVVTPDPVPYKIIRKFGAVHDVFFGDGWENWTRIKFEKDKDGHERTVYHDGIQREQFKLDLIKRPK